MKREQHLPVSVNRLFRLTAMLVLSLVFTTTVKAIPPAITSQPVNRTVCPTNGTTFGVSATNTTSFQWQVNTGGGFVNVTNGGVYSGATTNTLTLSGIPLSMSGNLYRCIATGPDNPPATSNSASLTVNDNPTITGQPAPSTTVCSGDNTSLTVATTGTVTGYQWYYVNGGGIPVALTNTGFYSGTTTATLSITGITASPNAVTNTYFCTIGGLCGSVTSSPAQITVNALPAITSQPSDITACATGNTSFSVTATGTGLSYQWQYSFNGGSTWTNVPANATYSGVTTNSLMVTANMSLNNSLYRCVVSGVCAPDAISNGAKLTVNPLLTLSTQPQHKTVCPTGSTSFSVGAPGVNPTYQWQVNTGSGWTNLSNGGIYSGVNTNLLQLSNITLAYDGYTYRCSVTDVCPPTLQSQSATLTVNDNPTITAQPTASTTICSGENASFSVSTTGTVTGYQWYRVDGGGTPIALTNTGFYTGVNTATLNIAGITSAPTATTNTYFCTIGGLCGSVTTSASQLTVNAKPAITSQPSDITVCATANATFSVTATGTGLSYQWQYSFNGGSSWTNITNSAIYSGATTNNLDITTNASVNNGVYRCVVSGVCAPDAISNGAKLTVNPLLTLSTQPQHKTVCPTGSTTFTIGGVGVNPTYQWQINTGSGWTNLSNGGIYSGVNTNLLQLSNITLAYDGYTYRCSVTDVCPPTLQSQSATLTVNDNPTITAQPTASTTICSGENASFSVSTTGTVTGYQWYRVDGGGTPIALTNTGFYTGVNTATLNITGITSAPTATTNTYFCTIGGLCGSVTTSASQLTVNAKPAITSQPSDIAVCATGNTTFGVNATGTGLTYQWQVNTGSGWSNLSNGGFYSGVTTNSLIVTAATTALNGYMYRCMVGGTCAPAVMSNAATLTIETSPAVTTAPTNIAVCVGGNTGFSVAATGAGLTYQWQVSSGLSFSNISNGGLYSGATTANLNINGAMTMHNNNMYRCIISGTCGSPATSAAATLTVNTAPAITTQPMNTATCPGGNAMFSVVAGGAGLTYQWQVNTGSGWSNVTNTGIYSNATTSNLMITGATATEAGNQYRCMISGTCTPSATTTAAELDIYSLPAITKQPTNKTVCLNDNTSFGVEASGSNLTYQWQVNAGSGWNNITASSTYSGVASATLGITSAPTLINGYMYRCVVGGSCTPSVTSSTATITVNQPTAITTQPTSVTTCEDNNVWFRVVATGTNLTYQWQVNTGTSWANLNNNTLYSGATTDKLDITNPQPSLNGNQYRCIVNGICAPLTIMSNTANLTIYSKVVITTQPAATTAICSGDTTTLSVGATGTGLSYQWYVYNGTSYDPVTNSALYNGATSATLDIRGPVSNVTTATTHYYCKVSGTCNTTSSIVANIIINARPKITQNPVSKNVCHNTSSVQFAAAATGTNITYQWQVNTGTGWSNISNSPTYSGVTTKTLVLSSAVNSMNGYMYRCVATGTCTPAEATTAATLIVTPLVTPTILISASNSDICTGSFVSFSSSISNGGNSPSYTWKVNNTTVGTGSSYSSSSLNDYDKVTCELTSSMMCPSPKSVTSNTIGMKVTAYQAPTVTITSSTGNSACDGQQVTFSTTTTWAGSVPTYQWQVNGSNVSSSSNSYSTTSLDSNDVVRCIMTSDFKCPSPQVVSSNNIVMKINPVPPATVSISNSSDTSICEGSQVTFSSYYTHSGPDPKFVWMKNGQILPKDTMSTYTTKLLADNDVIQCHYISSELCAAPVTSAPLTINLDQKLTPEVDLQVSHIGGPTYAYVFTPLPTAGGTNPQYEWFIDGVFQQTGPRFIPGVIYPEQVVTVVMTSNHPCVTKVTATSRGATTGVKAVENKISELELYPNPNKGRFTVKGEFNSTATEIARIYITSTLGQVVYTGQAQVMGGKLQHDVDLNAGVVPGVYLLRIEVDGHQQVKRFNISE